MRRMMAIVIALAAAGACSSANPVSPSNPVVAVDDPAQAGAARPAAGRAAAPTIAEIAVGNPEFSTLVAALGKAGLVDLFNGRQHFTVFAPTNAAFDAAAQAFGLPDGRALVEALDVETLTSVLTYHVTRGDRNAASVVSAGFVLMLDGNTARIDRSGGALAIEGAAIVATDIRASNGLVHVIAGVLLPPALRT